MKTVSEAATGYRSLAPSDWCAYESLLKGLLRVREPQALARYATEAEATLHQIQTLIIHRAWRWPLQHLPLILCRGPARSGATFLRWRNYQAGCSGFVAWQQMVQDTSQSAAVHHALLVIEQDRIMFNMQMSVMTFILRQIRECSVKLTDARDVAGSVLPVTT